MLERTITIDLDLAERKEAKASKRFPASIASDTPITRRAYDGEWTEVLSHSAGAIDLSRAPLPLIEGHDRSRVNIGIVTGLRIDGGKLRGEVVLGSSARAQELAADIADDIVRGLSVGYEILEQTRDEKKRRITATKWRPHEVSIVSTPADTTVGFGRSHMDPLNPTNPPPPAPDEGTRAAVELAVRTERERVTAIRSIVTRHDLGEAFAADLIARGASLEQVNARVLDRLVARDEATPTSNHISMEGADHARSPITAGDDLASDFQRAAIDSLLIRSGIRVEKPHAAAGDVNPSVYSIARTCLSRAGKSATRRMFGGEVRGPELLKRAAGTGDFTAILEGALHASIRRGWEDEPASHRAWVRVVPFVDFREAKRPILSSAPDLERVGEGGEYTHGYFSDEGTGYRIEKYGKIVALSWEVLVNDNLGAFLRVQPALGQAARRLESDLVYGLLALNGAAGPTMPDGVALFNAAHANLVATPGALSSDLLSLGRTLLRKQKSLAARLSSSGGGYLSLVPRFWIVPAEHETAAEVILANSSRRMTSEKSSAEWIASLELVVEPRLPTGAIYLAADSGQIDTIEMGALEENIGGPHMETEQGFDTDESRWKIRHTVGVKAIDHRGMVKIPLAS
jgi:hypothetical protein